MTDSTGYIYIPNWDKFQHGHKRDYPWVKLYHNLLGNDAWLDLNPADTKLLVTIWMLCGRYGNGRLRATNGWLCGQARTRKGSIIRLEQAGFIEIRASKALDEEQHRGRKRGSTNLSKDTRERAAKNGAAHADEKQAPTEPAQVDPEAAQKLRALAAKVAETAA